MPEATTITSKNGEIEQKTTTPVIGQLKKVPPKRGRARRRQRRANGGGLVNAVKDLIHVGVASGVASEAVVGVLRYFRDRHGYPRDYDTHALLPLRECEGRECVLPPKAWKGDEL